VDNQTQTSFIPKNSLSGSGANSSRPLVRRKKVRKMGLFGFIATILFIASIITAGGVYALEKTTTEGLKSKSSDLVRSQEAFDPRLIEQLERLDRRLIAANTILSEHSSISVIFKLLEDITLPNIRFSDFTYTANTENGGLKVDMRGEARGYTSIASQSDIFTENKFIRNPIFSNLDLTDSGYVAFDVSFTVDGSFIRYVDARARQ
jgi:hypothetical protein